MASILGSVVERVWNYRCGNRPTCGTSSADVNDGVADIAVSATLADIKEQIWFGIHFPRWIQWRHGCRYAADAILLGETNTNQAGFDLGFVDANGDIQTFWLELHNSTMASLGGVLFGEWSNDIWRFRCSSIRNIRMVKMLRITLVQSKMLDLNGMVSMILRCLLTVMNRSSIDGCSRCGRYCSLYEYCEWCHIIG